MPAVGEGAGTNRALDFFRRGSFSALQATDEALNDEHEAFTNAVRSFHCTLLGQFQTTDPKEDEPDVSGDEPTAALNSGKEPYLARFAQPYPTRPMWAAMPRPRAVQPTATPSGASSERGAGGGGRSASRWASDYSCAPLVCVVLRDSPSSREPVRSALCALAAHPVGLLVTVNSLVPEATSIGAASQTATEHGGGGLLLFAAVGLRWPRSDGGGEGRVLRSSSNLLGSFQESMMSKADQRQMVWAAVHESLQEDGKLPEVVLEVFMLQDVWLYDRLFRWLAQSRGTCSREIFTSQISQEELDLLVHEFGEETATHFLFQEHYTRHLRVAAAVAMLCIGLSWISWLWKIADEEMVEDGWRAVLSFFLPAWGFHFLASWRSAASKAGFRWQGSLGSVQNSVKEVARLQALESKEAKYTRFLRVMLLSVPLLLLELAVVLAVTTSFVCTEVYIYDVSWGTMSSLSRAVALLVYNLAFGIAFILILALFHPVSKAVTRLERHPDRDLHQWHLTTKIFGNWFLAVFLYFFVIAFCYIPFGDDIADFFAARAQPYLQGNSVIKRALEQFRPDIDRLAVDVFLFFLLQDCCRLVQILLPVLRAAWGLGHLRGAQKGKRNRNKRTAIFFKACGMCRVCCQRGPCRKRRKRLDRDEGKVTIVAVNSTCEGAATLLPQEGSKSTLEGGISLPTSSSSRNSLKVVWKRSATMGLLPPRMPKLPAAPAKARRQGEVFLVYCFLGRMQLQARGEPGEVPGEQVVMAACGLAAGGPRAEGAEEEEEDSPTVPTRLRVCYATESDPGLLEEDANENLGDLITLTCDQKLLPGEEATGNRDCEPASVRLNIFAEVLDQNVSGDNSPLLRGDSLSTRHWRQHDGILQGGSAVIELGLPQKGLLSGGKSTRTGTVQLGPVRVDYAAGMVRADTHAEALEKVPRALRAAREGRPEEPLGSEPSPHVAAFEEAMALAAEPQWTVPWLWWDEDLAGLYWDEVFELYAVKETFETFEIYAHMTTQFSYVCLFGIAVPIIPLLALLFTTMEVRQDQLRLLWLSRPPHPDPETLRFKGTVSVGAWYEIIKFTCHMSVAVNLLLWGLTYAGLSSELPADWSSAQWWRALALFSFCQQACFFLSGMLHRTVSQLDQSTAMAYLRRYLRLKNGLLETAPTSAAPGSCRQVTHEAARRQLTRAASQGLSCLI